MRPGSSNAGVGRFFLLLALLATAPAPATTILYAATSQGGSSWRYEYSVINDSLEAPILEFTIYFPLDRYADLVVAGGPPGWDPLVAQPDADLPDDGFYDALALAGGIAPGATLAGFGVTFSYLGAGAPGSQRFEVINPGSLAMLDAGNTALVPLPGSGPGLAAAVLVAAAVRVRRRLRVVCQ
ncbi:MAG: hypothetical protein JNK40_05135 [Chromatiales bacterium]|nr:hypothetical protein [Chromatiales bacterium]